MLNNMNVILQIELGFLMVGHTHEDIDALFGNISKEMMHSLCLVILNESDLML